jgi:hypothetical protein
MIGEGTQEGHVLTLLMRVIEVKGLTKAGAWPALEVAGIKTATRRSKSKVANCRGARIGFTR